MHSVIVFLIALVLFFVPFEGVAVFGDLGTVSRLVSYLVLFLSLMEFFRKKKHKPIPDSMLMLLFFLFWALLTLHWSVDLRLSIESMVTKSSLFLLLWCSWQYVSTRRDLYQLINGYILGCMVSLGMIFAVFRGAGFSDDSSDVRYAGGGLNQNNFAFVITTGIALAFFLLNMDAVSRWRNRLSYLAFILFGSVGVILTGSRAGAMSLLVIFFFVVFHALISKKKSAFLLLLIFIPTFCAASLFIPQYLWARVFEGSNSETFILRRDIWEAGIEVWKTSPFCGVGVGAFQAAITSGYLGFRVAHNTFLSVLVETGVVGLILFLSVWGLLFRKMIVNQRSGLVDSQSKTINSLGLFLFFAWLPGACTLTLESDKITWIIFLVSIISSYGMISSTNRGAANIKANCCRVNGQ